MGTITLKNYLTIILLILTLTSCSKGEEKMEIIAYGTPQFEEFVKNAPISLDEAWDIQLNFAKKNTDNDLAYNIHKDNVLLFFVLDGYYIFTMAHINNKALEGYFLDGIWVNANTGEVLEKNIHVKIKSQKAWSKIK